MTERYLEDFEAGQTFRSGRIRIDADRINSIRNRFISTKESPPTRLPGFGKRIAGHDLDEGGAPSGLLHRRRKPAETS